MTRLSTFGIAAVAATLAVAPAMAQTAGNNNGANNGGRANNGLLYYNNGGNGMNGAGGAGNTGGGYGAANGGYSNGRWNSGGDFVNNTGYGGGGAAGTGLTNGAANGGAGNNGGDQGNNVAFANNGMNPVTSRGLNEYYRGIGFGGYSGTAVIPRTSNGNNGNNGNNNGNLRISQRNNLLTDNGDARVSRVIGSGVWNLANQNIGTVNDVIIGHNGIFAVIDNGNHQVVVPFRYLVFGDGNVNGNNNLIMPRVTQAQLNRLPLYEYYLDHYPNWNGNNANNGNNNGNNGRNGNNNG